MFWHHFATDSNLENVDERQQKIMLGKNRWTKQTNALTGCVGTCFFFVFFFSLATKQFGCWFFKLDHFPYFFRFFFLRSLADVTFMFLGKNNAQSKKKRKFFISFIRIKDRKCAREIERARVKCARFLFLFLLHPERWMQIVCCGGRWRCV